MSKFYIDNINQLKLVPSNMNCFTSINNSYYKLMINNNEFWLTKIESINNYNKASSIFLILPDDVINKIQCLTLNNIKIL